MSGRLPVHNRVSELTTSLRSETKVKSRRKYARELIQLLSNPRKRAQLEYESRGGGGKEGGVRLRSDYRRNLDSVWRAAVGAAVHASELTIEGKVRTAAEDVAVPFRILRACDADVPTRGPFDEGADPAALLGGRGGSRLGQKEVKRLLDYCMNALSNKEVILVNGAEADLFQFLGLLCSRPDYVAHFDPQQDVSHVLSEVQSRILPADGDDGDVDMDMALSAAKLFANLVHQCTVQLGVSMHPFVRALVEMVSDWCRRQLGREDGGGSGEGGQIMPYIFSAVTNVLASHTEQAVAVMVDVGKYLFRYAKRKYKSAKGINRDALNEYFSAHLLVCEVAGKLQGLLPGDLGYLGAASLDATQINTMLGLVVTQNELVALFEEKPKSSSTTSRYGGSGASGRISGCKRKERGIGGVGEVTLNKRQPGNRRVDGYFMWNSLTKRQRRHLELCARLVCCAQRYFLADAEMSSFHDPVTALLDKAKDEKESGKKGGRHRLSDNKLPGLEKCPWIENVAMYACSPILSESHLSQASAGSVSSPHEMDDSVLSPTENDVIPHDVSADGQFVQTIPMLLATAISAKARESGASSIVPFLQIICACAEAFPRGECWASRNLWRRRKVFHNEASVDLTFRSFSSPSDVAAVVFLATDVLASFGGTSGDQNTQMWSLLCLLKLSESSSVICKNTDIDSPSSNVMCAVWRRLWDVLFRNDLQYRTYTTRAFTGSLGELVLMLLVEIIRRGLTDIAPESQTRRASASFAYERQQQIWNLPIFKNVSLVHSSLPFELVCTVVQSSGLSYEGQDTLSDQHHYFDEQTENAAAALSSAGRRFRLLGFCVKFVETVLRSGQSSSPFFPAAGACVFALISGKSSFRTAHYLIEATRKFRITEDVQSPPIKDIIASDFPLWVDYARLLNVETGIERDEHLQGLLSGKGARLFISSSEDSREAEGEKRDISADFVSTSMSRNLREFTAACMRRYLQTRSTSDEEISVESEEANGKDGDSNELPCVGRLAAAKVFFIATVFSANVNDVSGSINDLHDTIGPVLDDAVDKLKSSILPSEQRAHIASELLGLFRALIDLSSSGCGSVPRHFGKTANCLYQASKSVLLRYASRPEENSLDQFLSAGSLGSRTRRRGTNDFDDSEDDVDAEGFGDSDFGGRSDTRSDDDSFGRDEPSRKRRKAPSFRRQRRAATAPSGDNIHNPSEIDFPPDAQDTWVCAAIMAALHPSYGCCREVTDFLAFPEETLRENSRSSCEVAVPTPADCVVALSLFGKATALLRFQRLEHYFSERKSYSTRPIEEQSVFSLLMQVILQARKNADYSSPFLLYGFCTGAQLMQIVESSKPLGDVDERDYDDVMDVICPEESESDTKENIKRARRALKSRPYLRAAQLRSATQVFLSGGVKFHEKFDPAFATKLVIPGLASISCEVRNAAVSAVGAALKLLPNQETIVDSVLKCLPPLVLTDDETVIKKKMEKWVRESQGAGGELWDMEADAWRDSCTSLESSAIECRGTIAGCTSDRSLSRAIVFELICAAQARPYLEMQCLRACERAALFQGFSDIEDMLFDHDCEWILQEWLASKRELSRLPFLVSSPCIIYSLMKAQPSGMLNRVSRNELDEECTVVSRSSSQCTPIPLDMASLQDEVLTEYIHRVAPSLIPIILISSCHKQGSGDVNDADEKNDRRWQYLVESVSILTGKDTDSAIANVLRAHLHDIFALVLPMLQADCCTEDARERMEQAAKSAFAFLKRLLSEDVISRQGAEKAHSIVLKLLLLQSKNLSFQGGVQLHQKAFMDSIRYVADNLSSSPGGSKRGGLFQRAGSSTPECILHSRRWLCKSLILVDQERCWEVTSSICMQVMMDAVDSENEGAQIGLGFTVSTLCGIVLEHQLAHLRSAILDRIEHLVKTFFVQNEMVEQCKGEIVTSLRRLVLTLLQLHETAQNEFMDKCVADWRKEMTNVRRSMGLSMSFDDAPGNEGWGWDGMGASSLEANSNYETDLALALSSVSQDDNKGAAKVMIICYDLLELILCQSPALSDELRALDAMPTPTASVAQLAALSDKNTKFSLVALLAEFDKERQMDQVSLANEVKTFISLSKRCSMSRYERVQAHEGVFHDMSIEERSLLAGLNHVNAILHRRLKVQCNFPIPSDQLLGFISTLFNLCDYSVRDEIRFAASRCIGQIDGVCPTSISVIRSVQAPLSFGAEPLSKAKQEAMKLLANFIRSDNVETAVTAMDTLKALLQTKEGRCCFDTLDDDAATILLRPFVTIGRSTQSESPTVPSHYLKQLASRAGLNYDSDNTSWCWTDALWRCVEDGETSYEEWIKGVVTALLICCYGRSKTKHPGSQAVVKGEGEFFPICTAMSAQEHQFAAALFPAIIFDLLQSDTGESHEDPVRKEISIGAPTSVANRMLTQCFSALIGTNENKAHGVAGKHKANSKALGKAIDALDLLRSVTQIRFQRSKSHKRNPNGAKGRRKSNSAPPQWKGVPYGIVLHLHGADVARACIQSKRFASGLFYAELFADNWLDLGSHDALEQLSSERAEILKSNKEFPRFDISGTGDNVQSLPGTSDDLSCAQLFLHYNRQCLTELMDHDALKGVSTHELAINFGRDDIRGTCPDFLVGDSDKWRTLTGIDIGLQSNGQSAPISGCTEVAKCLEDLGLRHVLQKYLRGLDVHTAEAGQLKEKWFQDAWRTMQWDDNVLKGSVGSYAMTSITQGTSESVRPGGTIGSEGTSNSICSEGFHESLANTFDCLIREDRLHYVQYLTQARRSLLDEMRGAFGIESLIAGIPDFAARLSVMNRLDSLSHLLFGKYLPSELSKQFDDFIDEAWSGDSYGHCQSFSSAEFAMSVKEILLRLCSKKIKNPCTALANHLWLSCSFARSHGRPEIANASLQRIRQLVKLSEFQSVANDDADLVTSMRLRIEEAKILNCQGDLDSVRLAKLVISTLSCARNERKSGDVAALYSDALLLCGKWMTKNRSESGKTVLRSFLKPAAAEAWDIYKRNKECVSAQRRASEAHFSLGEFAARLFDSVEARVKSPEWKRQGAAAEGRRKELKESRALFKREKRVQQKTDLHIFIVQQEKEVEQDEKERKAVEASVLSYLSLAVTSFAKALSISDPSSCGDVSKHVFRMVSLWFNNSQRTGQEGNVNEIVASIQESIPSFHFVPLTYQIFSRIDDVENDSASSSAFQGALRSIVSRMAVDHPYHCLVQLIALANGNKIGTGVSGRQAGFYLDNIGSSKVRTSEELLDSIKRFCMKDNSHNYVASLIDSYSALIEAYIELAMLPTKPYKDSRKGIPLSKACNKFSKWSTGFKCRPCVLTKPPTLQSNRDYGGGVEDPAGSERVDAFDSTFDLTDTGIHSPKILICCGSKGRRFKQLVKGEDDIRQDAIMQQVFSTVNNLLKMCTSTTPQAGGDDMHSGPSEQLKLVTYNIVPLSPTSGVLEWVESTLPFSDFLVDKPGQVGAHSRYYPGEWGHGRCRNHLHNARDKRVAYDEICENFSPVFRFFFVEKFSHSPQAWHAARSLYTRSCAVSSIVGHVLGIGDRHSHNILIHQETGEVVHIDFGIVFEQGKVLPTPETVPFRLTRDMVDGMGPFGTEGTFSLAAEATARVLRENAGSLLTVLGAVVSDPLYKWSVNPVKARQLQPRGDEDRDKVFNGNDVNQDETFPAESANEASDRAMAKINEKLQGYEEGTSGEQQSVEGQVQLLISSARDPDNLCVLYPGWQPWL